MLLCVVKETGKVRIPSIDKFANVTLAKVYKFLLMLIR